MTIVSPGWYPDPDGKPCDRYWDGSAWTFETRPRSEVNLEQRSSKGEITSGWKITIGITFILCILLLVAVASDPELWTY